MFNLNKSEVLQLSEGASWFLDFIRVISSQAVLFGHAIRYLGIMTFLYPPQAPYMQNIAVVSFFYLSGFLISYTVLRKNQKSSYAFSDYGIDRFSRIYSAYLPSIVLVLIIDLTTLYFLPHHKYQFFDTFNVKTFFGNLLMLQGYPVFFEKLISFGSARPFWTLAIEWWLYMAFGWILLFKPSKVSGWVIKLTVAAPLLIVPIHNFAGRGKGLTYVWLWGVLSCLIFKSVVNSKLMTKNRAFILALTFTILAISKVLRNLQPYNIKFGVLLSAAFFFWLVFLQINALQLPQRFKSLTIKLASFSFTLYLIHYSIIDSLVASLKGTVSDKILLVFILVLSNTAAYFLSLFTESKHKEIAKWLKNKCQIPKTVQFISQK